MIVESDSFHKLLQKIIVWSFCGPKTSEPPRWSRSYPMVILPKSNLLDYDIQKHRNATVLKASRAWQRFRENIELQRVLLIISFCPLWRIQRYSSTSRWQNEISTEFASSESWKWDPLFVRVPSLRSNLMHWQALVNYLAWRTWMP